MNIAKIIFPIYTYSASCISALNYHINQISSCIFEIMIVNFISALLIFYIIYYTVSLVAFLLDSFKLCITITYCSLSQFDFTGLCKCHALTGYHIVVCSCHVTVFRQTCLHNSGNM